MTKLFALSPLRQDQKGRGCISFYSNKYM